MKKIKIFNIFILSILLLMIQGLNIEKMNQNPQIMEALDTTCGFTQDFSDFIKSTGYSQWNFDRNDIKCGAFGGKQSPDDIISNTPIIFIHGNSDIGFGKGTKDGYSSFQTGFRELATYFGTKGYKKSELYTTTWGNANPNLSSLNNHAKLYILQMRAFVEAVLAYTKASKVIIIGHSMGVTIGRKIIKGGKAEDEKQGFYNVGDSLKTKVKAFIGIAGGNLGLTQCHGGNLIPTCSNIDGFNPGLLITSGPSNFLSDLNTKGGSEGDKVYSIWSKYDDVILAGCVVWGKVTCRIPGQDEEIVKNSLAWGHFQLRDNSGPDIIKWV